MSRTDAHIALAIVAVLAAPVVGFMTMALIWVAVSSDGRGGMDVGVMLAGASVAAVFVGAFARWEAVRTQLVIPWLALASALTFAIAFGLVWLFYAGPFHLDFSGMD